MYANQKCRFSITRLGQTGARGIQINTLKEIICSI